MNKENTNVQFIPKRTFKNKKRLELRKSSPLTFCSEIDSEKNELDINKIERKDEDKTNQNDDYESDMEIMAILTGNDYYLKNHFLYDGNGNILKTRKSFPLL